jgi:hypothetical protein
MSKLRIASAIVISCASLAACTTSSPSDPQIGAATLVRDGVPVPVTGAWALRSYAFFDDQNDSYGVYSIFFTIDPAAKNASCSESPQFSAAYQLDLNTPQVFHQTSLSGAIPLAVGDMPVVAFDQVPDSAPPTTQLADFNIAAPLVTSGTVTVSAFDGSSIMAMFTASGATTDPISLTGELYAPICASH